MRVRVRAGVRVWVVVGVVAWQVIEHHSGPLVAAGAVLQVTAAATTATATATAVVVVVATAALVVVVVAV